MNIPGLTAITRIGPSTAYLPVPAIAARQGAFAPAVEVEIDQVTQLPVPPRFPWLSRLSQQLEAVAKQKAAFPSAPILGDNVDRAV